MNRHAGNYDANTMRLLVLAVRSYLGDDVLDDAADVIKIGVDPSQVLAAAADHGVLVMLSRVLLDNPCFSALLRGTFPAELKRASLLVSAATMSALDVADDVMRDVMEVSSDSVLLKGPGVGALAYDDPLLRPFSDLDLLVSESEWSAVRTMFLGRGFLPKRWDFPELPPRLTSQVTMQHWLGFKGPSGLSIDCTLDPLELGLKMRGLDDVFSSARTISIGRTDVRVLSPEYQLVSLCAHLNRHGFSRLVWFADIAALISRIGIDWKQVVDIARSEGIAGVLYGTLEQVGAVLGRGPKPGVMAKLRPALVRRALWAAVWPESTIRTFSGRRDAALVFPASLRSRWLFPNLLLTGRTGEKLYYFARRLVPPREYLASVVLPKARNSSYARQLLSRYVAAIGGRRGPGVPAGQSRAEPPLSMTRGAFSRTREFTPTKTTAVGGVNAADSGSLDYDERGAFDQTVTGGAAWSGLSQVSARLFQFLVTAVLARMLTPEDFGVVGVSVMCTGFIAMFMELGLTTAVIQRNDLSESQLSGLFFVNVVAGVVLGCGLAASSDLIAAFFRMPVLTSILRVLALGLPIAALGVMHNALLIRDLHFRTLALRELLCNLVYGAVAVTLAMMGRGLWSLVIGSLALGASKTLTLWLADTWRPRARPTLTGLRPVLSYGSKVLGGTLAQYVRGNVDYLVVGRLLGAAPLGFYTIAFKVADLPQRNLAQVIQRVSLPVFSRVRETRGELKRSYLATTRMVALVAFPLLVGIALLAHEFVLAVYGAAWAPSIMPMRVLSGMALLLTLAEPGAMVLYASGRAGLQLRITLAFVALVGGFALAALPFGILGVALAVFGGTVVYFAILQRAVFGVLGAGYREYGARLKAPGIAVLAMSVVSGTIVLAGQQSHPAVILAAGSICGAVSYLVVLHLMGVNEVTETLQRAARMFRPEDRYKSGDVIMSREAEDTAVATVDEFGEEDEAGIGVVIGQTTNA